MAKTLSKMNPLGTPAPAFRLLEPVTGKWIDLDSARGSPATLVMFICNHCPFVIHLKKELAALCKKYQQKGIAVFAINSNDVRNYPDDHPDKMKIDAKTFTYSFPYLYDETQEVAKAYDAACTPDFFVFDKNLKLFYRGQFDDSRPGNGLPVTGNDLAGALDAALLGKNPPENQKPSIGCNIKWKE